MTDADDDLTAPPLAGSGAEDSAPDAAPDAAPGSAPDSAPAPLREDMVQNAVAFLQHPQARALPSLPRASHRPARLRRPRAPARAFPSPRA